MVSCRLSCASPEKSGGGVKFGLSENLFLQVHLSLLISSVFPETGKLSDRFGYKFFFPIVPTVIKGLLAMPTGTVTVKCLLRGEKSEENLQIVM